MHYFVPLAYDRIDPEKDSGKGTIARCLALTTLARDLCDLRIATERECVFISSAGYTADSPAQPTPDVPRSLAEQIESYLDSRGFSQVIAWPRAWGTYKEIRTALRLIQIEHARRALQGQPKIYISTNSGHMPRVRVCCYFLQKEMAATYMRQARFHFVVANHSFNKKERLQETGKFFLYLYRFLFRRW